MSLAEDIQLQFTMVLLTGVFLTAALFYLVLFFGFSRKVAFLFFSLFCLGYAGKLIFLPDLDFFKLGLSEEAAKTVRVLSFYAGAHGLIGFLLYEFSFPRRRLFLTGFFLLSVLAYFLWLPYGILYLPLSFLIAGYGWRRRMEGSRLAVVGLLGLSVMMYLDFMQNMLTLGYFFGLVFFIVCMTLSMGRQVAQQVRQRQEAMLRSASLENQLLKKSIQPHFIFNSLASLQELIDSDPGRASRFVDSLAEEFRGVTKILGQPLIPIEDEIQMCRTHLEIMEFRKDAHFTFEVEGIEGNETVPPGLFHTLMENALTHGYAHKKKGHIRLSKKYLLNAIQYRFFNDSEGEIESTGNGAGLKYVETQLEEHFPGRWRLEAGRVKGGWEVVITVRTDKSPARS